MRRYDDEEPEQVCVSHQGVKYDSEDQKAVLFAMSENESDDVWVPRSLMEDYNDKEFIVEQWFAEKEGLDYV